MAAKKLSSSTVTAATIVCFHSLRKSQLQEQHDYVVYVLGLVDTPSGGPVKKTSIDMHAGETETSSTMISHPDLVHLDRANGESGADMARLKLPDSLYTGIWWYARFPNHYSGDGSAATRELGDFRMTAWIEAIVKGIQAVKADQESLKLQNEFFEKNQASIRYSALAAKNVSPVTVSAEVSSPQPGVSSMGRLLSLDVFRGTTIAAMILVNDAGQRRRLLLAAATCEMEWLDSHRPDLPFLSVHRRRRHGTIVLFAPATRSLAPRFDEACVLARIDLICARRLPKWLFRISRWLHGASTACCKESLSAT